MERAILLRYGEIHLKGLNRPFFERKLVDAILAAARTVCPVEIEHGQGRFFVSGYPVHLEKDLLEVLSRVFGVHSVSPVAVVESEMEAIRQAALEVVRTERPEGGTFKVEARRGNKRFFMNSMELNAELGGHLLDNIPGLKVDVHTPSFQLFVEVRVKTYLYTRIIPGPGGMPTGSMGNAMLLLSGGIDSPVAGYMMMRRGVELCAVYFQSPPHTTEMARRKVIKLSQVLSSYGCKIKLYSVNLTEIQETIYDKCDEAYLTVLTRRFMMRIAEALAIRESCGCLVTGENLGQVASQTMQALNTTNTVVETIPVFRPLIAFDKQEIITYAERIGTFDISIEPYEDCCTVFVPKHPATRPKIASAEKEEARIDMKGLLQRALDSATYEIIGE